MYLYTHNRLYFSGKSQLKSTPNPFSLQQNGVRKRQ